MKHRILVLTCAVTLVAGLAACGGDGADASLPIYTGGPHPAATTGTRPVTTAPTEKATGPAALPARSTYTYGGLKVIVNLPADVPGASRPSVRVFSDLLQGVGRTIARDIYDPSVSEVASPAVVKFVRTFAGGEPAQGIGSVIFTISSVRTVPYGSTHVSGCLDQSKLVQVRKDGSHFVGANTKKNSTLKMTGEINPGIAGPPVRLLAFAAGTC